MFSILILDRWSTGTQSCCGAFGRAISDHLASQADSSTADADAELVADVARAIRAGEIVPWYQPIVDFRTGKIIGLEALARRSYPDGRIEAPTYSFRRGTIPPHRRPRLAVARVALKELKEWQQPIQP